jgi:4-hydroxythreonine-4-phosphate dehydrogenase
MGDPNGIGPEVILKYLANLDLQALGSFLVVGSRSVFEQHAVTLGSKTTGLLDGGLVAFDDEPGFDCDVTFGTIDASAGRAAMRAVERAVDLCLSGEVDAVVTAPISKEAVNLAGYRIPGHTEFIADRCGATPLMIMVAGGLRVALLTGHVPLASVSTSINERLITARLVALIESLRSDFGIQQPRVAVLGLNPHAGEGGFLGAEERDMFEPAIARLRVDDFDISGPYPADGFFGRREYLNFDGILAAYHDQGLGPFKAISFGTGVNFTAGLPIVRTSPDHGTAFAIAGKAQATESSFAAAVELATTVVKAREG